MSCWIGPDPDSPPVRVEIHFEPRTGERFLHLNGQIIGPLPAEMAAAVAANDRLARFRARAAFASSVGL